MENMTFEQFIMSVKKAYKDKVFVENYDDFYDILMNASVHNFENNQGYKARIENEEHDKKMAELYNTTRKMNWDRRVLYKKLKTKKELKEEEKLVGERLIYFRNQKWNTVNEMTKLYIQDRIEYYLEWVQDIQKQIKFGFTKNKSKDDFKVKVQKAKQYPIDQILDFDRGKKATCPWHNEKTASLYLNKDNTVYCFGCNKYGDSIEVASQYYKCSFVEAVNKLAN